MKQQLKTIFQVSLSITTALHPHVVSQLQWEILLKPKTHRRRSQLDTHIDILKHVSSPLKASLLLFINSEHGKTQEKSPKETVGVLLHILQSTQVLDPSRQRDPPPSVQFQFQLSPSTAPHRGRTAAQNRSFVFKPPQTQTQTQALSSISFPSPFALSASPFPPAEQHSTALPPSQRLSTRLAIN